SWALESLRSYLMLFPSWRRWLSLFSRTAAPSRKGKARQTRPGPYHSLTLERLEDRLAPATSITILPGASGSGSQDSAFLASSGQLLFSAPDVGLNTLSTGALASIGPTRDIVVQA